MPRFAFRMFTLLVGLCGEKTETLAVVLDFTFFTGTSNGSETFCNVFLYKIFIFPIFSEFLELQKYGGCSNLYRLSSFHRLLL